LHTTFNGTDHDNKENKINIAIVRFKAGWTCSQVVLGAYCEAYSLNTDTAKAISCGFAGGMRCGETCGAVTAAIMVIGLWSAKVCPDETEQKKLCFETVSKFLNEFQNRRSDMKCRDILGYDIRDNEARKKYPGQQGKVCPQVIENSIRALETCMHFVS
jgi:C_GCAxxG_C_C family probable redox protein